MSSQQKTIPYLICSCVALLLLIGEVSTSQAFQEDPFGDPFGGGAQKQGDDKSTDPFGGDVKNDPFSGAKPNTTKGGSAQPGATPLPNSLDKVVLAIRETNPSTPQDFMNALRIMLDTRNYDEAKVYLSRLETANVSDPVAFDLVEKVGSDFIYRLIRSEQLAPKGASFGRNLLASSSRHLKSDTQLKTYFDNASSEVAAIRNRAVKGFRLAGPAGLAYLLKNVNSISPELRANYEITAALIGTTIREPLEAVLENGNEQQKSFAISVLGRTNSRKSIPFLLGPLFDAKSPEQLKSTTTKAFQRMLGGVPGKAEAKRFLTKQIKELNDGATPFRVNALGKTTAWIWTPEGQLVSQQIDPRLARILRRERISEELYQIDPADSEVEKVFLASQLSALKAMGRTLADGSINKDLLASIEPKKWISVLDYCVANKLYQGATAAAEIIGQMGDESLLSTSDFSPLIRAMEQGDRSLRFACTQAIISLNPQHSFPGANRFIDSVVYFAGTQGRAKVLVAHPKYSEGQNLVGTLAQRGFSASAATTGRDLFRQAQQDSDLEFILLSDAIDRPNLGELLVQLRSLPALSKMPIGILSQKFNQEKNERIALTDPFVTVMKQPYRISFRVEQILPANNQTINNAIITWSVLSDLLEQALAQKNRTVAIQMLDTMRATYDDDLSKLAVDNSAIVDAMSYPADSIRKRASRLFLRITGKKPAYEKPIEQPTASGRVMIVHPKGGDIRPLQEKLKEVGYTVALFDSVDAAIKVLPNIASLRFVIGSNELGGLDESRLRDALAKKYRLNPTPITFVSRADSYREAPIAKPVFDSQLEQLMALSDGVGTAPEERLNQAAVCLRFLEKVLLDRKSYAFANPLRHEKKIISCLRNPSLAIQSLPVLAELATPAAQQAVVDFASENSRPLESRQAAVQAFSRAIDKRGILLTKGAILEQYARYNKSETLDQQTQQVLGSVLDAIEEHAKK